MNQLKTNKNQGDTGSGLDVVGDIIEGAVDIASDGFIDKVADAASVGAVDGIADSVADGAADCIADGASDAVGGLFDSIDDIPALAIVGIAVGVIAIIGGVIVGIAKLIKHFKK